MIKFIFPLLLFSIWANAQVKITGKISGYGNNQVVTYYPPIGNFANTDSYIIATKIKEDNTFDLLLDVHQLMMVKLRIATQIVYLMVRPSDHINISLKNTHDPLTYLKISGDNANSNYWYNIYMFDPGAIFNSQDSILTTIKYEPPLKTFALISKFLRKEYKPLDSLASINQLDKESLELYKKQIIISHISIFINQLNWLYNNTNGDSIKKKINLLESKIYKEYNPIDPDNLKLMFGINTLLFTNVKDFIRPLPKINLADTVFGVYNQYLYLPPLFCEDVLGIAIITEKKLHTNEFDFEKGYAVFKKKFPDSRYLEIINQFKKNDSLLNITQNASVIIDSAEDVQSLQDIIDKYKGQNLFIDLWATWCIPCRQEFPYYKDLYKDFSSHNVHLLYISIDDAILKESWKNVVSSSNLSGSHYLANKTLLKDIKNRIYKSKSVVIPRYLLVNKYGKIIDIDAPRPSENADLMNSLEKL